MQNQKSNDTQGRLFDSIDQHPYHWMNVFFTLVLTTVFAYAGMRAEHIGPAIHCSFQGLHGVPCPSCGLTRAFACILKGEPERALHYHAGSLWLFAFFSIQLLMRGASWFCSSRKLFHEHTLALTDGIFSAILFILCFGKGYGIF